MRLVSDDAWAVMTIWQEARGEAMEGKVAIGEVIRNRVNHSYNCNGTVSGCVLAPLQFSGWNARDTNRIPSSVLDSDDSIVAECIKAWRLSANSTLTHGAVLYYSPGVGQSPPDWAVQSNFIVQLGRHKFYRG